MQKKEIKIMFWDMRNTAFCSDQVTVSLEFLPFP